MMTILLERHEYLRATHLPRQRWRSHRSRSQFTSVDSFIVKGPIRLRDSRG